MRLELHNIFRIFKAVVATTMVAICSQSTFAVVASDFDSLRYEAEVRATFSSGENTPFWLVSNLQGLGSPEKNNGFVRGALFKDIDGKRRFSWGGGVDLVGSWRSTAPFRVHQLYGELRYRSLGAILGSKEIWGDFNNPRLSSGGLLYSGNATPVPQLRIGIFDYAPFWGTRGWLNVKGYMAYGMFTDTAWQRSWAAEGSKRTENVLYHSKGLWLRGGDPDRFPLTGEIGIEMASQFGGTSIENGKVVHNKHGFSEWLKAFFPTYKTGETLLGEETTVDGNMVGQYTIGLQWSPRTADWSVRAYYEHYFEDQSMMTFEYGMWKDGLWGVEGVLPANSFVSRIVYEFLYSKDQAGAVNNNSSEKVPEQVSGRDNYYNHSLYTGWQHWGMGIGNPLMISPVYNASHQIRFMTTRIIGHHLGIAGNPTQELDYRLLLSWTKNWGTYSHPLPEVMDNFNALVEVNWKPAKLKGWYGGIGVALDGGDLLGKSLGVALKIGKTGFFKF